MDLGRHSKSSIRAAAIGGTLLILSGLGFLRLESRIRADGVVLPAEDTRIFAGDDGVILRLHVAPGDHVQAGDLIAELDNAELRLRLLALDRDLLRNAADQARAESERLAWRIRPGQPDEVTAADRAPLLAQIATIQESLSTLFGQMNEQQIASLVEVKLRQVEQLRAELALVEASAQAGWQRAGLAEIERDLLDNRIAHLAQEQKLLRAEKSALEERVAHWRIAAPIAGQIIGLPHRFEGQAVARGDLLVRLAPKDGPRIVRVYAPARNIDLLESGCQAIITSSVFDAFIEGYAHGRVIRFTPGAPQGSSPAGTYEIDILIEDSPYPLVYDSPAEARILLGRKSLAGLFLRSQSRIRGSGSEAEKQP